MISTAFEEYSFNLSNKAVEWFLYFSSTLHVVALCVDSISPFIMNGIGMLLKTYNISFSLNNINLFDDFIIIWIFIHQ